MFVTSLLNFRDFLVKSSTSSMLSSNQLPRFGVFWCPGVPRIYRGQQQFFGIQTSGRWGEAIRLFPTHFFGGDGRKMGWATKPIEKGPGLGANTPIPLWFFGFRKWWRLPNSWIETGPEKPGKTCKILNIYLLQNILTCLWQVQNFFPAATWFLPNSNCCFG